MKDTRERVKLKNICSMRYGKMPEKSDIVNEGFPIFSGYGIVGFHKRYLYKEPEVVLIARGVGGTGDIKWSPPNSFITNLSIVLQPISEKVHKKFLFYKLSNSHLRRLDSGAAQSQITIANLENYEILLPSFNTQNKIASILSAYDDLIENNNRRIKILEQMAQTIYREWFVNFRFPGHEKIEMINSELGMIPDGCEVRSISNIEHWNLINENIGEYSGKKEYFATANIDKTNIIIDGEWVSFTEKTSRAQKKPIIYSVWFARMKDTYKVLGFTSVNEDVAKQSILSSGFVGFKSNAEVFPFLYYTINSKRFHTVKNQFCTGATQVSLNNEGLSRIMVTIPPLDLIKKYGSIALPIIDEVFLLQKKNKVLQRTRDLLLPRLMSGEIEVVTINI